MINYDIRNLSMYFREIHSRYYIDTEGCVYTSLNPNTNKILISGKRVNIKSFKEKMLPLLNNTNKQICRYENTDYYLMYNGTMIHRLKTVINDKHEVSVCLVRIFGGNNRGNHYSLSRLLAKCFIGDIDGKEVHHIDKNRLNNKLENLQILTKEEHRGKGNFKKYHFNQFSND